MSPAPVTRATQVHTPVLSAVENPSHCDFVKLRTILIRTHMHDLKDITGDCHYENYRAQCIQNMARCVSVYVCVCVLSPLMLLAGLSSKMTAEQRVESPIPLLQISTPDAETEKLIKMKDDEVSVEKKNAL